MQTPEPARAVLRLPKLVTLQAFKVAGPSRRFDDSTKSEIPQLWSRLIAALPFEGQEPGWASYGVVSGADCKDASFDYLAGVPVVPDCALPAGFSRLEIPAASYAVFRITLDGTAPHPQIKRAMATIWGELVPASGLRTIDLPNFELYDGQFAPDRAGVVIDFHVPVQT